MTNEVSHPRRYRWVILGVCVLAYSATQLTRWSYSGLATYISQDLHLDKGALGLLGAAFFYPYALAQVPWGRLTDRFGGRVTISIGLLAMGGMLALFATAQTFTQAIVWRVGIGIVSACGFVPIAGLLAGWFNRSERGLANGVYHGVGGGLGEATAFLLLPAISVYVLARSEDTGPDWRGAMSLVAGLIVLVGLLCLALLRSGTPHGPGDMPTHRAKTKAPHVLLLRDPVLWLLGAHFAASVIATRVVAAWLPMYAADIYQLRWGYAQDAAVLAGGTVASLYAIGHAVGSPSYGWLSDWLLRHGVGRLMVAACGAGMATIAIGLLIIPMPLPWMLSGLAVIIGFVRQTFPLINALAAERWGVEHAGEAVGWINMAGQLAGAVFLSISGFLGLSLASASGGALSEYAGIWALGAGSCGLGALVAWLAARRVAVSPAT